MTNNAQRPDRRTFLKRVGQASVVAGLGWACDDDSGSGGRDVGAFDAMGRADGARRDEGLRDRGVRDLGLDGAASDAQARDAAGRDRGPAADAAVDANERDAARDAAAASWAESLPDFPISKGPWMHIGDSGELRLLFETVRAEPLVVTLNGPGGERRLEPELDTRQVDFRWPDFRSDLPTRDEPGLFTMQSVPLGRLEPGARHTWRVDRPGATAIEGRVRAPAAPDQPVRLAWVADTMWPSADAAAALLGDIEPDLLVHGGDIQYQSNPGDTWTGMFQSFASVFRQAPIHFCVGNHEYEGQGEIDVMYRRLFSQQGERGVAGDWRAIRSGPLRFLLVNSEEGIEAGGAQERWLTQRLQEAAADPTVRQTIVGFHRPYYTFSRSGPNLDVRARLHALFAEHGVRLVLTGHNHCYERFDVDGVTYVVDGGGGAGIYDPNHRLEEIRRQRPEEIALRAVAAQTRGVSQIEIAADGTLTYERRDVSGGITDRFTR